MCFPIGVIYLPSERGRGGAALLFCFCFVPVTPRDLAFWAAAPSQHAGISDRREVAKREENRRERGWKCLSERLNDAICQKHPPHPPPILPKSPSLPPPAPGDDITSRRSNMAGNTCRAACGRWKFFPTAVALLQAVAPATRWNVSRISDFMRCNSLIMAETVEANDENKVIRAACEGGRPDVMWSRRVATISGFHFKSKMH